MVKKIPIVGVDVTSNIGGTVQPLGPMFGGSAVSTNSLQSIVDSKPSIIYADSFQLSAINIVIPKDFTRTFSDTGGIVFDSQRIGYSKRLTDSINSINDNRVFDLSKFISNLVNTSDNLNRVVSFIRKLNDTPIVTDNFNRVVSFIRKPADTTDVLEKLAISFRKPLSDISVIQDLTPLSITKRLADLLTVDDSDTIDFTKANFETIVTSDINDLVFDKALVEALQLLDFSTINVQKILSDSSNVPDSNTIDFTKVNVDSVSASSFMILNTTKSIFDLPLIEDKTILNFEKIAFDSITADSFSRFNFIKVFADTATVEDLTNVFDGSTYTINKTIADSVISSENLSRVVDFNRVFQDDQLANELLAIDFSKILESLASNSDNAALNVSLFKTDSTVGFVDVLNRVVDYNRSFADEQNQQNDNLTFSTSLFKTDNAVGEDVLNRSVEYNRSFADEQNQQNDNAALNVSLFKTDSTVGFVDELNRVVEYNRLFSDEQNQQNDNLTFNVSLFKTDSTVGFDDVLNRVVDYNRSFTDEQGQSDLNTINFAKVLADSTVGFNDVLNRVVDYNRSFTDEQGQSDLDVINFTKALADSTVGFSDDEILSVTKVFSDLPNITDEISAIDFNKVNSDQIVALDLLNRTVSFNRSLTDTVLQADLAALSFTRPLSDAIGHVDGPIQFDSDGWAVDYVVSGYIFDTRVVFDLVKALADFNNQLDSNKIDFIKILADNAVPLDNIDVFDGSTHSLDKSIADTVSLFDNSDINMNKALAEIVIQPDGPVQYDSDGWAIGYVVSGYIFDTRVIFDIIKPLTDLVDPQDANAINFVKPIVDENITLDDDVIDFTKALADVVTDNLDGPVQYDSDGWAVDYVVSGYIFDTRVVFDVIKALSDINSPSDDDVYDLAKVLSDLINSPDDDIIDFTKAAADETIILDDDIFEFTKPLVDILDGSRDGPRQYDSDGWAIGYVVSGYIFDTRVVFDIIKPLTDTVQQPDDTDVLDLNKALADLNNQSDSNTIDFTKVLSDNATPLDNIDVFDGSTHSLAKVVADTAPPTDSKIIQFAKVLADSANQTEAGKIISQNYIDHTYFADDYIGESRLIA